ncbi:MAG: PQQ-dependent dehydrogenase, methanol/ethanol family [Proteobacteria bacterium]|nr:PQQ-dependent dehydrogenase, methanol/ethanol family [Pseudomonadota bacterium]
MFRQIIKKKILGKVAILSGALLVFCMVWQPVYANDELSFLSKEKGVWSMYGKDYSNTRFSELDEIGTKNVSKLNLKYMVSLGTLRAQQSTPLVIGNILYVTSSNGPKHVMAMDAETGETIWTYNTKIPGGVEKYACCDVGNKGVAYGEGKVFFGQLDGKLVALDAKTGKEVWVKTVVDHTQGSVLNVPPLIVKDMVITGFGGGEYGAKGQLTAYKIATGEQVWRTVSIPKELRSTWKGDSWKRGGGVFWYIGSYDPKLNMIYWGTSNPSPWSSAIRGNGSSNIGKYTNKHSASTLAMDADTGKIVWHYQTTPHDAWDYDGVNEMILIDMKIKGKKVPVLMKADRNGFFYVLNRKTGKLISAEPFVYQNWAKKIDMKTGMPVENPEKRPGMDKLAKNICPHLLGGKNWYPMSYSPKTGLVYIPTLNLCMDMEGMEVKYRRGSFYLGKDFPTVPGPGGFGGELVAWDPVKQKKVWGVKEKYPLGGGTLVTAGNIVFHGAFDGFFRAFNAKTGKMLWKFSAGSGIGAAPMTFTANGKQFVAVVVGKTITIPGFLGALGVDIAKETPPGGTMLVFGL